MRALVKIGVAVASAVAIVTTTPAVASAYQPPVAAGNVGGSAATGSYPDIFLSAGYTQGQVDAKITAAYHQLFHGAPGTDPDRTDGQSIYYQLSPDTAYVEDIANHDVRTEGMGYAMTIAVETGHKKEFNDLWNFAKTYMQLQSGPTQYMFAWHTDITGKVIDTGVAPDGDQWISAALAFASGRWGNGTGIYDYNAQAELILHAMWHAADTPGGVNMFDATTYLPIFSPPYTFLDYTDPSYALPAFYKIFALVDPTDSVQWGKAYKAGETLLTAAANPTTGLAPCYSNFDGTPYISPFGPVDPDGYAQNFQEDAWRAIANANIDAEWWGQKPWQRKYSNTLERFFNSQGITTYVSRYHLDGTPLVNGQNTYEPAHAQGLVAMNSTSAITATTGFRSRFVQDLWNQPIPSGQARYYDGMLYLLGLLYDSGSFKIWWPQTGHRHDG